MNLVPRQSLFDIDSIFDNFWSPSRRDMESTSSAFAPRVDVLDTADHIEISAELPGVKKEDIHVTLDNGILTLSAESHQENKEEKDGKIVRQERRYGKYSRSFDLGDSVKESDVNASFEDGILKLKAPKATRKTSEARRINIA
ncbi:Hsp20/alpha crystallin family protein [Aurantivibrio infirmus]